MKMAKSVSATDAKNNFGGLLEDVAALGRVDVVKHGRLVAVVLSPRMLRSTLASDIEADSGATWGKNHMIPPERARAARLLSVPTAFDDD